MVVLTDRITGGKRLRSRFGYGFYRPLAQLPLDAGIGNAEAVAFSIALRLASGFRSEQSGGCTRPRGRSAAVRQAALIASRVAGTPAE